MHVHDVEPPIELVADLVEIGHLQKAVLGMNGEAGLLARIDAGNDRPVAKGPARGL